MLSNLEPKQREQLQAAHEALLAGQIAVEPNDSMTLSMMFAVLDEVARVICELPWVLWEAREGEFVLSDRPLTRHDRQRELRHGVYRDLKVLRALILA